MIFDPVNYDRYSIEQLDGLRRAAYADARAVAGKLNDCDPDDLASQSLYLGEILGLGQVIYGMNAALDAR